MQEFGVKKIILNGIGYTKDITGVVAYENGILKYYKYKHIDKSHHGTRDIYSSIFVEAYLNGLSAFDAASAAADFVVVCIENTLLQDPWHCYGVKFEPLINKLITCLQNR